MKKKMMMMIDEELGFIYGLWCRLVQSVHDNSKGVS